MTVAQYRQSYLPDKLFHLFQLLQFHLYFTLIDIQFFTADSFGVDQHIIKGLLMQAGLLIPPLGFVGEIGLG